MADMPDLSHLTAEERAIIENVMMRQRQEDEQQKEIMQRKQDEVNTLEDTIRQRSEQQRKAGIELEATCHICLKTKFADGVGHICHYCNIRCCARCGGKTTIRGKVIWVCMVCRKKQELLSSTGQWMKTTEGEGFICATGGSLHPDPHDPSDKRPKLERARSAAEKENLPLQRTGSGLRRQYSHDSSVDMLNPAQRRMQQQIQASNASQHFQQSSLYGTNHHQSTHQQPSSDIYSTDEDPKYYQGELDGLMLKHPHLMHPRQQRHFIKQQQHSHSSGIQLPQPMQSHYHRQEHLHPSQQHLQQHSSSGAATQNINQHKRPIAGHLAQQTSFSSSEEEYDEAYDRRDRPSVLVTSPSSPDRIASGASGSGSRYSNRISSTGPIVGDSNVGPIGGPVIDNSNVGGRIQIKLGFESGTLQLILTVICAANLTYRANGATRNPYVKIFLLPDRCDKSKRRSKPLTNTNDPRWGETFVYSGLRRADLNNRYLEITVWDYVRYGANDFLGEVLLDLRSHPLDDEAEWYTLHVHQESNIHTLRRDDTNEMDMILTPTDHLSPPSTTSRLSDSDTTSECDIDGIATGRDGASISSLGSSSSPPAETDLNERRSRRDMSPQGKKRATAMVARDYRTVSGIGQSYHNNNQTIVTSLARRNGVMAMNQRSHSAAPSDNYRSANIIRRGSLSPPEDLYQDYSGLTVHNRVQQRSQSRSATATPTGSPKKRQLPQVPQNSMSAGSSTNRMVLRDRDRLMQDFEERGIGRFSRYRTRQPHHHSHHQQTYRSTGMGGWERCYTGLSDSDLTMHSLEPRLRPKNSLSPDKDFMGDFGDSDMESVVSVTSSAFSTQSERPRGSRGLSSEYDVRDRGSISAGTNNRGHQSLSSNNRESYRDRNEREPSRSLSDRDPREQDSFNRSLSTAEGTPDEKIDGSLSDTAVGMPGFDRSRRNPNQRSPKCETPTRDRDRFGTGMGKKSNSTSQLSATGRKRRIGFGKKGKNSFTVHRSEEVLPGEMRAGLLSRGSSASSDGEGSIDVDRWSPSLRVADGGQYSDFVDGLGPGQLVGRQVLGAASLGDIQLSLCHQKGYLEVEVIRARGLQLRPGSKVVPAPCVKVYLLNGKKIIKKLKTVTARRTLDPLYQQQLVFREPFAGCLLQVIVWGDYSRMDKKVFMGAALIELDNINLSNIVIGWYRLFASSSMVSVITSSMSLSRRSSITSLESLKL